MQVMRKWNKEICESTGPEVGSDHKPSPEGQGWILLWDLRGLVGEGCSQALLLLTRILILDAGPCDCEVLFESTYFVIVCITERNTLTEVAHRKCVGRGGGH